MNSVFVGDVSDSATAAQLEKLFAIENIQVISIHYTAGSGYALVDCPDQNAADHAIEVLNGFPFLDKHLRVEPSLFKKGKWMSEDRTECGYNSVGTATQVLMASSEEAGASAAQELFPSPKKSHKVQIRQIAAEVNWEEFEQLVKSHGGTDIFSFERGGTDEAPIATITLNTSEAAQKVVSELNGTDYGGSALRVFHLGEPRQKPHRRVNYRQNGAEPPRADFPLRMSVDARYVGAIIGQGGANIRAIAKESKARCVVDINRGFRDQGGNPEKVINVFGLPENSSKAAVKILEVIQREMEKETNRPVDKEMKIRAHNNLVGRLIGKAGGTIKKIMEETGCNVFVSNIGEMTSFSPERTITIRGPTLEAISAAEEKISSKLRAAWENDMSVGQPQPGPPPFMQFPHPEPFMLPGMGPAVPPYLPSPQSRFGPTTTGVIEVTQAWIPNSLVGSLIGTKGVHIRHVMRMTGAHVRVEPQGDAALGPDTDRLVTITGTEVQQWQAQLWLFQRVAEQSSRFFDEVRLCLEVNVPLKLVGRLIGKNGANIRDLQRMTGAQVKIPNETGSEQAAVQIAGNFEAIQAVQVRLRQLVAQFHQHQQQVGNDISAPAAAPIEA